MMNIMSEDDYMEVEELYQYKFLDEEIEKIENKIIDYIRSFGLLYNHLFKDIKLYKII
jgi:lactam utilization protein B